MHTHLQPPAKPRTGGPHQQQRGSTWRLGHPEEWGSQVRVQPPALVNGLSSAYMAHLLLPVVYFSISPQHAHQSFYTPGV
jgi:hypothetical protein